ncbi:hypothetical protein Bca52824_028658 [Brassica carinata]|uniref:Uncharacterized protein n=1 Tax=Brassica carinata TaxID=52824 RepID=A0A8X7VDB5_BRACI|nr:hypothetical protein Bca52824_028658 [Brassica carinata]
MSLEKIELSMLGNCKKVIISKDNTILIGGAGDKKYIRERCEQIRSTVEASESDYDKGMLQDRLAKLSGSVAVIKIGGTSEREIGKKIDRVTDALNDTKAALEEGIVPGGGVALLRASKELEKLSTDDDSYQKVGIQIIQNALKTPVYTIASNAGVDGEVIVDKLLESDNPDVGYDAAKGEYVDMVKSGIIDPVKVIRTALVDAARDAEADFNIYNMATQIRGKKKFVADGVFYAELNKILTRELAEDGYVGAEAKVTTTEEVVVTEISKKEEASPGTGGGVGCTGDKLLFGLVMSMVFYIGSVCGIVVMYYFYVASTACALNIFFISLTVLLLIVMMVMSLHSKVKSSLMSSGIMASYIVFYVGLPSEGKDQNQKLVFVWLVLQNITQSFLIAIGAIVMATFSTGIDSESFSFQFRKDEAKEEDDIPYSYGFFHLVFSLGAMYFAMLFISWNLEHSARKNDTRRWSIDVGWTSTWVKIVNEWFAAGIYLWKLIAPIVRQPRVHEQPQPTTTEVSR